MSRRYLTAIPLLLFLGLSCSLQTRFRGAPALEPGPDGRYEIAFIEFTERGNLHDRNGYLRMLKELEARTNALVIVFVHGWKHNASPDDRNVQSFRRLLSNLSESKDALGGRDTIGIYIGWPGLSTSLWGAREMTYWARKSVAEEVGDGGVTEVLMRIENALSPPENILLVVGHSFGGAVVLSALNDVLIERIVQAAPAEGCSRSGRDICELPRRCVKTEGFGNGVILLNPAVEANRILPLKELVTDYCFPSKQPTLLHVISTEADTATHRFFPVGQWLSMLSWKEEDDLHREYRTGGPLRVSEKDLDTTAVGNFDQFWTGRMVREGDHWTYCSFAKNHYYECGNERRRSMAGEIPDDLIPTRTFEPLAFVYTDETFMNDHNDVFNESVSAYVATIAMETLSRLNPQVRPSASKATGESSRCFGEHFSFHLCFLSFEEVFRRRFAHD